MAVVQNTLPLVTASSDDDLVAAIRAGDDRAFEELYDRYGDHVRRFALARLRDAGRAEDVTQEAFISALRRLRATDTEIAFRPWIYEIARNACTDELRRLQRRGMEVPLDSEGEEAAPHPRLPVSAGPEVEAENRQRLRDLQGAFGGLSSSHHQVIVLRELEGLSYQQIGQRLGMSRPSVESTLFRARRRLSQEYEELASGRRCAHVVALMGEAQGEARLELSLRQRRQVSRHLAHCQPCRQAARLAGLDEELLRRPQPLRRLGALVSLPWLRLRRGESDGAEGTSGHLTLATQPLEAVAPLLDPSWTVSELARGVAAVVTMLAAAAGGSLVTHTSPTIASPVTVRPPAAVAAPAPTPPPSDSSTAQPLAPGFQASHPSPRQAQAGTGANTAVPLRLWASAPPAAATRRAWSGEPRGPVTHRRLSAADWSHSTAPRASRDPGLADAAAAPSAALIQQRLAPVAAVLAQVSGLLPALPAVRRLPPKHPAAPELFHLRVSSTSSSTTAAKP